MHKRTLHEVTFAQLQGESTRPYFYVACECTWTSERRTYQVNNQNELASAVLRVIDEHDAHVAGAQQTTLQPALF